MKKVLSILFFLFITQFASAQIFTQTFVDRCTNEVKIVTANFTQGSATVAFYSRVRTFTYQQFVSGELQAWLMETYNWWSNLSPCSTTTTQATQAQQQAQQAQQQAQQASTAANNATSSASSAASTANQAAQNTNSTGGTTNGTNNTSNQNSNTNNSSSNSGEGSSNSSGNTESGTSGETGSGEQKGGEEGSGGTESENTEGSETESKSEESKEEVKEESKEEKKEEKEEESKEEKKDEESKEEEDKKEKKKMMPIQLRADAMSMQTPFGNYNAVLNMGLSQSSIFGDVSYNANVMVWDNLKQISILGARSKVHMVIPSLTTLEHQTHKHYGDNGDVTTKDPITPPQPYVSHITAFSLGYTNNYGYSTISTSYSGMKPFKNGLVVGAILSASTTFVSYPIKEQGLMLSYNLLATKPFQIGNRITYSPAVIWSQTPYMGKPSWPNKNAFVFGLDMNNELRGQTIDGMVILSNSFTIQLTRRFSFNTGWTLVKSTNPEFPMINSFMIGAKLPF